MSQAKGRAALDKAWEFEKVLAVNRFSGKEETDRMALKIRIYLDIARVEFMEREPQEFPGLPSGWPSDWVPC